MILNARMVQALKHGALAQPLQMILRGSPTLIWALLRGLTLGTKMMWLDLRVLQVGVETWLLAISLALVGVILLTMSSPQVVLVAGETPQVEAPLAVLPRMAVSPGEKSQLVGMTLTSRQRHRAGGSNPKHPTAGEIAVGAIMQETGENQMKIKKVPPPTLCGKGRLEAGRKNHGVGECLPLVLVYLQVEEMLAGERQFPSVQVDLLKVGAANLKMAPVGLMEEKPWGLGVALVQRSQVQIGVEVSKSPQQNLLVGRNLLHLQSDEKWKLMMEPQPGVTLVPAIRRSTCGTGTIQECHRLKSTLEAITRLVPTTITNPPLTITFIMGQLHLYRITLKSPKTKGPLVDPWILWSNIRLCHLTTEVL